jgi:hypothetical protein
MGVEPTRDRAERPPSRFEDGETHRGPYTSIRDCSELAPACQGVVSRATRVLHVTPHRYVILSRRRRIPHERSDVRVPPGSWRVADGLAATLRSGSFAFGSG